MIPHSEATTVRVGRDIDPGLIGVVQRLSSFKPGYGKVLHIVGLPIKPASATCLIKTFQTIVVYESDPHIYAFFRRLTMKNDIEWNPIPVDKKTSSSSSLSSSSSKDKKKEETKGDSKTQQRPLVVTDMEQMEDVEANPYEGFRIISTALGITESDQVTEYAARWMEFAKDLSTYTTSTPFKITCWKIDGTAESYRPLLDSNGLSVRHHNEHACLLIHSGYYNLIKKRDIENIMAKSTTRLIFPWGVPVADGHHLQVKHALFGGHVLSLHEDYKGLSDAMNASLSIASSSSSSSSSSPSPSPSPPPSHSVSSSSFRSLTSYIGSSARAFSPSPSPVPLSSPTSISPPEDATTPKTSFMDGGYDSEPELKQKKPKPKKENKEEKEKKKKEKIKNGKRAVKLSKQEILDMQAQEEETDTDEETKEQSRRRVEKLLKEREMKDGKVDDDEAGGGGGVDEHYADDAIDTLFGEAIPVSTTQNGPLPVSEGWLTRKKNKQ
jgi:hypothetical protein